MSFLTEKRNGADRMIKIKMPIVGKQRPRFNSENRRAFTPNETRQAEHLVRNYYKLMKGAFYPKGAVEVTIIAYMKIGDSYSKARCENIYQGKEFPLRKPDVDNIAKLVLDGLNGVAYKDDAQVTDVICRKRYSLEDYEYIEVCVSPVKY